MARIVEDIVVLKFSRIVRDDDEDSTLITSEIAEQIEKAMDEIYGNEGTVVEARIDGE